MVRVGMKDKLNAFETKSEAMAVKVRGATLDTNPEQLYFHVQGGIKGT